MTQEQDEAPQDIVCSGGIKLDFGAAQGGQDKENDDSDG